MSTEAYYVVRKEDGERLVYSRDHTSMDLYGHISEEPVYEFVRVEPTDGAWRFATRKEAEEVAEEYVGTVQRVTVTIEDVGLRWRDPELVDGKQVRTLTDGPRGFGHPMAQITTSPADHKYRVSWFMGRTGNGRPDGLRGQWGDLDNAKAAAVEAVKATWT